jgi:membrane associated rhomboid family serine protease
MFLPLKDSNPLRVIPFQIVTAGLIAACVATYLWQVSLPAGAGTDAILSFGLIPAVLFDYGDLPPGLAVIPAGATLITSMFMHAGWLHLGGNMAYLWVFGDNIEDAMGHVRFLVFYVLCGIAAALAHGLSDPDSISPMIGASGAVSGVLGAYLLLHPKVRVIVLLFYRIPLPLPAFIVLGGWLALQVYNVYLDGGPPGADDGGPAWWAHIGGFAAGMVLIPFMRRKDVPLFDRGRYRE